MFDLACLTHAHAYNKIHLCKKMNEIVHVPVHDSMIFKFFKSNMDAYVFKFSSQSQGIGNHASFSFKLKLNQYRQKSKFYPFLCIRTIHVCSQLNIKTCGQSFCACPRSRFYDCELLQIKHEHSCIQIFKLVTRKRSLYIFPI